MRELYKLRLLLDLERTGNPEHELDDEAREKLQKEIERYEAHAEEMYEEKRNSKSKS